MRHFVEHHFNLVLILSCFAGLFIPPIALLPNETAILILAALMFLSCYRLRDGGFASVRWKSVIIFYLLRYGLLPVALWALARISLPDYAMGVFLLTLVPAGVASPAFAAIYGGTVAPAFAIVILSQLAAPAMIPLQFAMMGTSASGPTPLSLFITMVWCILLPMAVYALVKNHRASNAYFYRQNKFFSVLLIAAVIALAIAKQREVILTHLPELLAALAISCLCFAIYIVFGWWAAFKGNRQERIAYAACSGFNNAALGVSLALLHFPPNIVLFFAVSEIAWSLLPGMFKIFLKITNCNR